MKLGHYLRSSDVIFNSTGSGVKELNMEGITRSLASTYIISVKNQFG